MQTAGEAAENFAMLKLRLAKLGVSVGDASLARAAPLELVLPDESWVRVRIESSSPLVLFGNEEAMVRDGEGEYPVRVAAQAEFVTGKNPRRELLGSLAQIRGLYALVALDGGCGLSDVGHTCSLCLGRELTQAGGQWWPVDEVVEALGAAFDEGVAEFVHFNLGYVPGDDAGVSRLGPYVEAVRRYFDARIGVTMHPPAMLRAIDASYAMGFDVVCYSLEAAGADALERSFPGRARFIGRHRYLDALRHAAAIFPSGAVWSELAMGLDSPEQTMQTIAELAAAKVVPLLSLPQASPCDSWPAAAMAQVATALFEETLRNGINMSWARDLSTALTPLEARYFVSDAPQLPVLLNQISRNRLGALATRSLARLRRRLRVRRVRASFDSSRL